MVIKTMGKIVTAPLFCEKTNLKLYLMKRAKMCLLVTHFWLLLVEHRH